MLDRIRKVFGPVISPGLRDNDSQEWVYSYYDDDSQEWVSAYYMYDDDSQEGVYSYE